MGRSVLGRLYGARAPDGVDPAGLDRLPNMIRRVVVSADLGADHLTAAGLWAAAAPVLLLVSWLSLGAWVGLFVGIALVAVPAIVVGRWTGRRARRVVEVLPVVVDMVARSVRSGASFDQALAETATSAPRVIAGDLGRVVDSMRLGRSAGQALSSWARQMPLVEVRITAAALALMAENSAAGSRALDGVAQSLRDRAALDSEVRAQAAQALASQRALLALPGVFLLIDAVGDQELLGFLLGEPLGRACLAMAVVLELVGGFWIAGIVRRALP